MDCALRCAMQWNQNELQINQCHVMFKLQFSHGINQHHRPMHQIEVVQLRTSQLIFIYTDRLDAMRIGMQGCIRQILFRRDLSSLGWEKKMDEVSLIQVKIKSCSNNKLIEKLKFMLRIKIYSEQHITKIEVSIYVIFFSFN